MPRNMQVYCQQGQNRSQTTHSHPAQPAARPTSLAYQQIARRPACFKKRALSSLPLDAKTESASLCVLHSRKIKATLHAREPTTVKPAFSIHVYSNIKDHNAEVCHELKPDQGLSFSSDLPCPNWHDTYWLTQRLQEENYIYMSLANLALLEY